MLEGRAQPLVGPYRSAASARLHLRGSLLLEGLLRSWGLPIVVVGVAYVGAHCSAPTEQQTAQQRPEDAAHSVRRGVAAVAPVSLASEPQRQTKRDPMWPRASWDHRLGLG